MKSCIKGVTPEWYELDDDRDQPAPTAFYLVPLDGFGRAEISMLSLAGRSGAAGAVLAGIEVMNRAFKLGVKNWKNIEDPDDPGKPLAFSQRAMPRMREEWILEVGARVLQISDLGAEQAKNSASPSS